MLNRLGLFFFHLKFILEERGLLLGKSALDMLDHLVIALNSADAGVFGSFEDHLFLEIREVVLHLLVRHPYLGPSLHLLNMARNHLFHVLHVKKVDKEPRQSIVPWVVRHNVLIQGDFRVDGESVGQVVVLDIQGGDLAEEGH